MNPVFEYLTRLFGQGSRFPGAACVAVVLAILAAGLWPFSFFPKNRVEWLPDQDGVRFYGQGMIVSADPLRGSGKPVFPDRSITLEIRLRPALETKNAPNILSLHDGKSPDIFSVRQWRSHMVVWCRTDDPAARKRGKPWQEMGFSHALPKDQESFITIASGAAGTVLYANGLPLKKYPRRLLLAGGMEEDLRLILGNSPGGDSSWTGDILGLAVYSRALSPEEVYRNHRLWTEGDYHSLRRQTGLAGLYAFAERKGGIVRSAANPDEALILPETFSPLQRKVLAPLWADFQWNSSFVQDIAVNLLGFIPFGFFLCAFLLRETRLTRGAVCLAVALAGTGLSLSVELIQVFLPTRESQWMDVAMNSAGTVLGIALCGRFRAGRRRGAPPPRSSC